ncbi:GntP family permease [Testudinibacter sp. TR-2022]|uniref:GntP family permease n=1 Tax=Testudinibacter sp. TR-2022 TaxID=2585029 RepID=UPI00111904D9|nr:GntP family permease [Testudinibacter sp. TR-2022]TNH06196.1 GntP family permease [Pasteurellaceae bacterium Phil11]TNH23751.1 GntP family permease [Testudinibacter sp. TR-2022]TNH26231.1 GntP family permease [Testudinibacter sp. TR-2022]
MLGILLGLTIIIVLAFWGWSIIWVAPIAAGVVALFGGLDLLTAYTGDYMSGFVGFAKTWFPIFMLGAIFGKLMEVTSMANAIAHTISKWLGAKRAILAVVVACSILTYGGVSLFVVVFAVYPLGVALFRQANISRQLLPGTIALGAFTYTMTAIPGTPQIQNLIPTHYFHTTPAAAPLMGIVSALIMAVLGYYWLVYRETALRSKGLVFIEPESTQTVRTEDEENLAKASSDQTKTVVNSIKNSGPNFWLSMLPLISVVVALNVVKLSIIIALLIGIILILVLSAAQYKHFIKAINEGANGSVLAIVNTSAAVGFGSVVKAVPGFAALSDFLLNIKGSPLISEAVSVTALAGATGSASGGMGIALESLGQKYYELAMAQGLNIEHFHRVASIASGGLDTLPHNGAVLTLLVITGMSHRQSYFDIAMVSLVIPTISLITVIGLASLGIV